MQHILIPRIFGFSRSGLQSNIKQNEWKVGSKLEVYSQSHNDWFIGIIININEKDSSIDVKYKIPNNETRSKHIHHNDNVIRPLKKRTTIATSSRYTNDANITQAPDRHDNYTNFSIDEKDNNIITKININKQTIPNALTTAPHCLYLTNSNAKIFSPDIPMPPLNHNRSPQKELLDIDETTETEEKNYIYVNNGQTMNDNEFDETEQKQHTDESNIILDFNPKITYWIKRDTKPCQCNQCQMYSEIVFENKETYILKQL
eukprot:13194_1